MRKYLGMIETAGDMVDYTLRYPDDLAFAFDECPVLVQMGEHIKGEATSVPIPKEESEETAEEVGGEEPGGEVGGDDDDDVVNGGTIGGSDDDGNGNKTTTGGSKALNFIDVTITHADVSRTVSAYAHDDAAQIDIQQLLQSFFAYNTFPVSYTADTQADTLKRFTVDVYIELENGASDTFTFTTDIVWGARLLTDTEYNTGRKIKAFAGYPFTVSIYTGGNTAILIEETLTDEATRKTPKEVEAHSICHLPLTLTEGTAKIGFSVKDTRLFDDTFDDTFDGEENISTLLCEIACISPADEGVYIRWVDRNGFYCYWLFKKGDTQTKTTATAHRYNDLTQYDETHRYQNTAGTRQSFAVETVLPICAPLVDKDTWHTLLHMTHSPMIAAYINGGWVNVNIQAATYTYDRKMPLQDFTCNMVYPELNTQKL